MAPVESAGVETFGTAEIRRSPVSAMTAAIKNSCWLPPKHWYQYRTRSVMWMRPRSFARESRLTTRFGTLEPCQATWSQFRELGVWDTSEFSLRINSAIGLLQSDAARRANRWQRNSARISISIAKHKMLQRNYNDWEAQESFWPQRRIQRPCRNWSAAWVRMANSS